jgi:hypothetical protein
MQAFYVGQNLSHPKHGPCSVTFVGKDYVGVMLDNEQAVLLKKESFFEAPVPEEQEEEPEKKPHTWPESTFVFESGDNERHALGSHWDAFFEDNTAMLKQMPAIIERSSRWVGGHEKEFPRAHPEGWTIGLMLAWPNHRQGLISVISVRKEGNLISSVFPFVSEGRQYHIPVNQVIVWESGVEAQIETKIAGMPVTFFDIAFVKNRLWYEAGVRYEFILTGIAYHAQPSELMEIPDCSSPDVIEWQNMLAREHGLPLMERTETLSMRGMSMFMTADGMDADDYVFRSQIKTVRNIDGNVLGQAGWFITVKIRTFNSYDFDLAILITERAWQSDVPPAVGQDIEGRLWLQGYMCYPPLWR